MYSPKPHFLSLAYVFTVYMCQAQSLALFKLLSFTVYQFASWILSLGYSLLLTHTYIFPLSGMLLPFLTYENFTVFYNEALILPSHDDVLGYYCPRIGVQMRSNHLGGADRWSLPWRRSCQVSTTKEGLTAYFCVLACLCVLIYRSLCLDSFHYKEQMPKWINHLFIPSW